MPDVFAPESAAMEALHYAERWEHVLTQTDGASGKVIVQNFEGAVAESLSELPELGTLNEITPVWSPFVHENPRPKILGG